MGLSSNSIIHFTKSITALKGILTNNFKIKYCRETIYSKSDNFDLLIPIVSFCDIPFSQIINHVNSYGCYGIGLKKSWAEANGLNPVLYMETNSTLSENIFNHLYKKIVEGKKNISELTEKDKYTLDFMRYMKNYQGDLKRVGKKTIQSYRFSDEREWRFVVDPKLDFPIFGTLKTISEEDIPDAKQILNEKIKNERLKFSPEDINYIIIQHEAERDIIINTLESVNGKYPFEQVKRLTSRILSVEQLKTDF